MRDKSDEPTQQPVTIAGVQVAPPSHDSDPAPVFDPAPVPVIGAAAPLALPPEAPRAAILKFPVMVALLGQALQLSSAGGVQVSPYRALLLGDSATEAAKTQLMNQIVAGAFSENILSTIGVDFRTCRVDISDGYSIQYRIWSTAGQERIRSIGGSILRDTNPILIMPENFATALQWKATCERNLPGVVFYTMHYEDNARLRLEEFSVANLESALAQEGIPSTFQHDLAHRMLATITQRIIATPVAAAAVAAAVVAPAPAAAAAGAGGAVAGSGFLGGLSRLFGFPASTDASAPAAPVVVPTPARRL